MILNRRRALIGNATAIFFAHASTGSSCVAALARLAMNCSTSDRRYRVTRPIFNGVKYRFDIAHLARVCALKPIRRAVSCRLNRTSSTVEMLEGSTVEDGCFMGDETTTQPVAAGIEEMA